jgi:hypothetical protein
LGPFELKRRCRCGKWQWYNWGRRVRPGVLKIWPFFLFVEGKVHSIFGF